MTDEEFEERLRDLHFISMSTVTMEEFPEEYEELLNEVKEIPKAV